MSPLTPLACRLLQARDFVRSPAAGGEALAQLQHILHLARQSGEHPVPDEALEAERLLGEARALIGGEAP